MILAFQMYESNEFMCRACTSTFWCSESTLGESEQEYEKGQKKAIQCESQAQVMYKEKDEKKNSEALWWSFDLNNPVSVSQEFLVSSLSS